MSLKPYADNVQTFHAAWFKGLRGCTGRNSYVRAAEERYDCSIWQIAVATGPAAVCYMLRLFDKPIVPAVAVGDTPQTYGISSGQVMDIYGPDRCRQEFTGTHAATCRMLIKTPPDQFLHDVGLMRKGGPTCP